MMSKEKCKMLEYAVYCPGCGGLYDEDLQGKSSRSCKKCGAHLKVFTSGLKYEILLEKKPKHMINNN